MTTHPDNRLHAPANILVRIEAVTKHYRLDSEQITALNGVNLNIEEGVFLKIVGPSGSGKST
jgi:ABC-type lipoprotein export system ATPase subunit